MSDYERFPPDGPSRRAVWALILIVCVLLLANIIQQTVT